MSKLVETLKRFNRKERNWLIRDALGTGAEALSGDFRKRLADTIRARDPDFQLQADAWWVTDYHLDWLVAALTMMTEGEDAARKPHPDPNAVVRGNQQDIDLLIASGTNLILIEAKGVGAWANRGTDSKLTRLAALPAELFARVTPYFVFFSPAGHTLPIGGWPSWGENDSKPFSMTLQPPTDIKTLLRVERCDQKGKRSATGKHWLVR